MSLTSTSVPPTMVGGLPPPPGVVPNFVDPYSLADPIRAVGIFCMVLTTLTTVIRLYTKFCIIKSHGWADCKCNSESSGSTYLKFSLTAKQIPCSLQRYHIYPSL